MGRGVQRFGSMRGFSNHRTGGGGKFFSKWKEKGTADVWLHAKELPIAVYRHQVPMVIIKEDRNDRSKKETHVWSKNFVCHETPEVLEAQYFRDRETAERKSPPERCGLCKLIEWCYQQALAYEETRGSKKPKGLSFVTPLFRFVADDPAETTVLHVGGLCNLFGKKDLSDAMKKDMSEAKISPRNSWKENAHAKCQYAMRIVDNAHPDGGVQIAVETGSLGDKIKKVLNDELENDVDIQRTPYMLRWKYFDKETDLNKKYDAIPVRKQKPTPRILGLLRGEAPTLPDDLTTPFNQQSMRAILERHCVLPNHEKIVPWDDLFPSKAKSEEWAKEDAEEEKKRRAAEEKEEAPSSGTDDDEGEDGEGEDEDEEMFACDNDECGKPVRASDKACPHCGTKFEVVDDEDDEDDEDEDDEDEEEEEEEEEAPKEEPKPKLKSRSEALAAKKTAGGGSGGSSKTKGKATTASSSEGEEREDDDGIPFVRNESLSRSGRV